MFAGARAGHVNRRLGHVEDVGLFTGGAVEADLHGSAGSLGELFDTRNVREWLRGGKRILHPYRVEKRFGRDLFPG